jgi:hypothetical protein
MSRSVSPLGQGTGQLCTKSYQGSWLISHLWKGSSTSSLFRSHHTTLPLVCLLAILFPVLVMGCALLLCCCAAFLRYLPSRVYYEYIVDYRPLRSVPLRHLAECVSVSAILFPSHSTVLFFCRGSLEALGRCVRRDSRYSPRSVILLQHRTVFEIVNWGMGNETTACMPFLEFVELLIRH